MLDVAVVSATGGASVPFTVGQAFRQGHVPSGSTLVSDISGLQTVVKNRWPDGSVKFAILSGHVDTTANTWRNIGLSVAAAPATTATPVTAAALKTAGVTASVQFGSFGTASWSGGDWDAPVQTWVSGPEMSSWKFRKPIGSDPQLSAWLEVRAYKSGRVEVLPWIENGQLRLPSPTAKSGTASFTLNGTQRFSQALNLLSQQRAVLASGTTLSHWVGGDPQVTPRQGAAYLMDTRMVPAYRAVTASSSPLYARLPTTYVPLGQAGYPDTMGSTGYHESIGMLPEWDVAYLSTRGDPRAYRGVLISALSAGRYGIHFRDETTQRPLRFSSHPNLVLTDTAGVTHTGSSSTGTYTPGISGGAAPTFATSHHPSLGYMAYLLTGWNYFLEESQFLATANFLKQSDTTRQGAKGILETSAGTNTTRGAAWALRSLAQAAAITPDGDVLRDEFVASIGENVNHYHGRYVAVAHNTLGLVQPYQDYEPGDPYTAQIWMEDFFTAAFGYLKDLQLAPSTVSPKLDAFLAWKYRSIVGRLGGAGSADYTYRQGAQYTVNYAPSASVNWSGAGPWYGSWGAVARAMALPTSGAIGESLDSGYPTEPGGYWANLMPALSYAVDHGAAGAADAWTRVSSASNFPTLAASFNDAPVWSVKPRSR